MSNNLTTSLPVVLTLIFLILKLTGVIAWSWFFVFLPLIVAVGITIVFFFLAVLPVLFIKRQK